MNFLLRPLRLVILLATGLTLMLSLAYAQDKTITLTESELAALIDKRINERLRVLGLDGETAFNARVAQGIQVFIEKQREAQRAPTDKAAKNLRPVSDELDRIKGNPNAVISLIEYSDFECPYCKRFHATPQKILEEYGDKVNWVYRHFPLSFHNPGAQMQAEAAECAGELGGDPAFWKFTDKIYERTKAGGKGFPLEGITPLAVEIGLNESAFTACYESRRHEAKVNKDLQEGSAAGVTGTPGNFLRNNKSGRVLVIHGAQPYNEVKAAIEQLLADDEG